MGTQHRVELQAEITGRRDAIFPLLASADGLEEWLDAADMDAAVGKAFRFRLGGATATGDVLAVDAPQHVSFSWDWEGEPLGANTVVALDAIDHGARTHLTLRHVGFRTRVQADLHRAMWTYWFDRLKAAATAAGERSGPDPKGPQAT